MSKKLLGFFSAVALFPHGDGRIVFYDYRSGQVLETQTTDTEKISRFFHSRLEGEVHPIDPKLIDLLDNIQDHFKADAIELISGYRSPTLNAKLRRQGLEVAEESQHMEGKAADIHIDEVTEEGIAAYVKKLAVGGVGFYPKNDFVHVDVADVRYWELPDRKERPFIGMRESDVWQLYTDKNIYLPKETIEWSLANYSRKERKIECPTLELCRRGNWKAVKKLVCEEGAVVKSWMTLDFNWQPDTKDPFGKYRLTLPPPKGFPHLQIRSNEFYRKVF